MTFRQAAQMAAAKRALVHNTNPWRKGPMVTPEDCHLFRPEPRNGLGPKAALDLVAEAFGVPKRG